ncbi:MAG: transposase, partial [Pseudomonadota bacterium]
MFRLKRQQRSLFDLDVYLPEDRLAALDKTWAGPFRRNILPLIDEDPFEPFYCPDNGRPNTPVAILIGLCLLKEWHNLTDAELLGSLEWDIRWQYALDINMDESDVSQKTL